MIGYTCGEYDILRSKDLQDLDKQIQLSRKNGNKYFGVGVYDSNLCQHLGIDAPLKSLEDRLAIMSHIRGVDFVFPVISLHEDILRDSVKQGYLKHQSSPVSENAETKTYEYGYAPGTYDLFHVGHLENLTIASNYCQKLIVGIKADELVEKHKKKKPFISAEERMEILRHFKFVYDVYTYYTRDLHIANDWFNAKYGKSFDVVFFGSDLKNDFSNIDDIKIIFTPRSPEKMKTRSTSAYRTLILGPQSTSSQQHFTTSSISEIKHSSSQDSSHQTLLQKGDQETK